MGCGEGQLGSYGLWERQLGSYGGRAVEKPWRPLQITRCPRWRPAVEWKGGRLSWGRSGQGDSGRQLRNGKCGGAVEW